jgi:enoyl-CoA hydratase/carnithine racemase
MSEEFVKLEKDDRVGWLTLNRPGQRNALSLEMMTALIEKLDKVAADPDIRVVVLRSNGPGFCAGHDLKEMVGSDTQIHEYRRVFSVCSAMMQRFHSIPQPVIAQVHGIATAAGCQLVATCDLAIAEEGARFQTPGVLIGLFCTTPMVPLVRTIGRKRALDMLFTARFVSAEEALSFGLINRVAAADALADETAAWAHEIARHSRYALSSGKEAFYRQVDTDEASAYNLAQELMSLHCMAEDAQEGINAFIEKRKAVWKDR